MYKKSGIKKVFILFMVVQILFVGLFDLGRESVAAAEGDISDSITLTLNGHSVYNTSDYDGTGKYGELWYSLDVSLTEQKSNRKIVIDTKSLGNPKENTFDTPLFHYKDYSHSLGLKESIFEKIVSESPGTVTIYIKDDAPRNTIDAIQLYFSFDSEKYGEKVPPRSEIANLEATLYEDASVVQTASSNRIVSGDSKGGTFYYEYSPTTRRIVGKEFNTFAFNEEMYMYTLSLRIGQDSRVDENKPAVDTSYYPVGTEFIFLPATAVIDKGDKDEGVFVTGVANVPEGKYYIVTINAVMQKNLIPAKSSMIFGGESGEQIAIKLPKVSTGKVVYPIYNKKEYTFINAVKSNEHNQQINIEVDANGRFEVEADMSYKNTAENNPKIQSLNEKISASDDPFLQERFGVDRSIDLKRLKSRVRNIGSVDAEGARLVIEQTTNNVGDDRVFVNYNYFEIRASGVEFQYSFEIGNAKKNVPTYQTTPVQASSTVILETFPPLQDGEYIKKIIVEPTGFDGSTVGLLPANSDIITEVKHTGWDNEIWPNGKAMPNESSAIVENIFTYKNIDGNLNTVHAKEKNKHTLGYNTKRNVFLHTLLNEVLIKQGDKANVKSGLNFDSFSHAQITTHDITDPIFYLTLPVGMEIDNTKSQNLLQFNYATKKYEVFSPLSVEKVKSNIFGNVFKFKTPSGTIIKGGEVAALVLDAHFNTSTLLRPGKHTVGLILESPSLKSAHVHSDAKNLSHAFGYGVYPKNLDIKGLGIDETAYIPQYMKTGINVINNATMRSMSQIKSELSNGWSKEELVPATFDEHVDWKLGVNNTSGGMLNNIKLYDVIPHSGYLETTDNHKVEFIKVKNIPDGAKVYYYNAINPPSIDTIASIDVSGPNWSTTPSNPTAFYVDFGSTELLAGEEIGVEMEFKLPDMSQGEQTINNAFTYMANGQAFMSTVQGFTTEIARLDYDANVDASEAANVYSMPKSIATAIRSLSPSVKVAGDIPIRTGYTFKEWNTKADGSGTSYTGGSTYLFNDGSGIQKNAKVYAIWRASDIKAAKQVIDENGDGVAVASEDLSYKITAANVSANPQTFTIKDDLANVVLAGDVIGTNVTLRYSNGSVTTQPLLNLMVLGIGVTLNVGESVVVEFDVRVKDNINVTTIPTISNTAYVSDQVVNATIPTATGTIDFQSAVKNVVDASGDVIAAPGEELSYKIYAKNDGSGVAKNVLVKDDLINLLPHIDNPLANQVVIKNGGVTTTHTVQDLIAGITLSEVRMNHEIEVTFKVTVKADIDVSSVPLLVNEAVVGPETPGTSIPTGKTDYVPGKDVTDANGDTIAEPGEELTYIISTQNIGAVAGKDVLLQDSLVNVLPHVDNPVANVVDVNVGGVITSYTVQNLIDGITIPEIAAGVRVTATFKVKVKADLDIVAVPRIVNKATLGKTTPEVVIETGKADYLPGKDVTDANGDTFAEPGEELTYIISTQNTGTVAGRNVLLQDSLVNVLPHVDNPVANVVVVNVGGVNTSYTVQNLIDGITIPTIGVGVRVTATFKVNVKADLDVVAVPRIVNKATLGKETPEVVIETGKADYLTDKDVTDSNGDGYASTGEELTYIISAQNTGKVAGRNVLLQDSLVNVLPHVDNPVANVVVVNVGGLISLHTVQNLIDGITIPSIGTGISVSATFKVKVKEDLDVTTVTKIVNKATLGKETPEIEIPVKDAELKSSKHVKDANGDGYASLKERLTYTITSINNGPAIANNIKVQDTLVDVLPYVENPLTNEVIVEVNGVKTTYTVKDLTDGITILELKVGEKVTVTFDVVVRSDLNLSTIQKIVNKAVVGKTKPEVEIPVEVIKKPSVRVTTAPSTGDLTNVEGNFGMLIAMSFIMIVGLYSRNRKNRV